MYSTDEFAYGIAAPEPTREQVYIDGLVAEQLRLEREVMERELRIREIGEELYFMTA